MSVPDAEAIVGAYLRSRPVVKELDARVVASPPDEKGRPWVQVTQIDFPAVEGHRAEYLLEWIGQLDCYAGDKEAAEQQEEASDLTRGVREAIRVMNEATFAEIVVTGSRIISSPRQLDTDIKNPRIRYPLTVAIYLHPR